MSAEIEPRVRCNAVRCEGCQTVIESHYRHDFVSCPCGRVCVDGGHDYSRVLWKDDTGPTFTFMTRDGDGVYVEAGRAEVPDR